MEVTMMSALRCCSTGSKIRARGMNIDGNAIISGIRLFAGTTTARGGRGGAGGTRPPFELLDEDIEERFVKASFPPCMPRIRTYSGVRRHDSSMRKITHLCLDPLPKLD